MNKYLIIATLCLTLTGCAKHGIAVHTGEDYKGRVTVGWGPMTVFEGDVAGEFTLCIPSKNLLLSDPDAVWCEKWIEHITKETP